MVSIKREHLAATIIFAALGGIIFGSIAGFALGNHQRIRSLYAYVGQNPPADEGLIFCSSDGYRWWVARGTMCVGADEPH